MHLCMKENTLQSIEALCVCVVCMSECVCVCNLMCVYTQFVCALIAFDGNATGSFLPSLVEMLRINSCFNLYELLTGLSCRGLHHLTTSVSCKAEFNFTFKHWASVLISQLKRWNVIPDHSVGVDSYFCSTNQSCSGCIWNMCLLSRATLQAFTMSLQMT